VNLTTVIVLLAKNSTDFRRAVNEKIEKCDLNKCIEVSKNSGVRNSEAMVKRLMSIVIS